jgi:hypothetical protein
MGVAFRRSVFAPVAKVSSRHSIITAAIAQRLLVAPSAGSRDLGTIRGGIGGGHGVRLFGEFELQLVTYRRRLEFELIHQGRGFAQLPGRAEPFDFLAQ